MIAKKYVLQSIIYVPLVDFHLTIADSILWSNIETTRKRWLNFLKT